MKRKPGIKRVLIAHQATIPHYRLAFYETIERLRPDWWNFSVVYDLDARRREKLYTKEGIDESTIQFGIEPVVSRTLAFGEKKVVYQTFLRRLSQYDLLVIENVVYNLSYPLAFFRQIISGRLVMIWGHGKDFEVVNPSIWKKTSELFKLWQSRKADGFFAYTAGVRDYLVQRGLNSKKVFTLNNTIDIVRERENCNRLMPSRDRLRADYGLDGKMVLLFVGRFNHRKKLHVLTDAFSILHKRDQNYKLLIVGSGDISFVETLKAELGEDAVAYHGTITGSEQLGPFYVMSDLLAYPGDVGLAPLHALSYDLTPVLIDAPTHGPEFEYFSHQNAVILPAETTSAEYATAIKALLQDEQRLSSYRSAAWPSIQHLTIDNMATHFIQGINAVLGH